MIKIVLFVDSLDCREPEGVECSIYCDVERAKYSSYGLSSLCAAGRPDGEG